jgi:hypothetical protein
MIIMMTTTIPQMVAETKAFTEKMITFKELTVLPTMSIQTVVRIIAS